MNGNFPLGTRFAGYLERQGAPSDMLGDEEIHRHRRDDEMAGGFLGQFQAYEVLEVEKQQRLAVMAARRMELWENSPLSRKQTAGIALNGLERLVRAMADNKKKGDGVLKNVSTRLGFDLNKARERDRWAGNLANNPNGDLFVLRDVLTGALNKAQELRVTESGNPTPRAEKIDEALLVLMPSLPAIFGGEIIEK